MPSSSDCTIMRNDFDRLVSTPAHLLASVCSSNTLSELCSWRLRISSAMPMAAMTSALRRLPFTWALTWLA